MSEIFVFTSIIIFLIILSAFFSSSETALTAVSELEKKADKIIRMMITDIKIKISDIIFLQL